MTTTTAVGAPKGAPTAKKKKSRDRSERAAYLYLIPAYVVFGIFLLYPLLHGVWISLYDWDGLTPATWVGVGNYTSAIGDPMLRKAFTHSAVLIVFYAVIPILLALLLTGVMTHATKLKRLSFFRVVIFLPQVVASVVVATTWTAIYAPDGVLNKALSLVGLDAVARPWLGDFSWALPAVGLIGTWIEIGLCLVLFLAGVSQIEPELYEAARLDGAGAIREFFAVTLPGLRPQIAVAMTLTVVAGLKSFDLIFVATRGGPGTSTTVPGFEVYHRAFDLNQVGSACAVGILLTVVILIVTTLIQRIDPGERA
ncbi:raffinose/stachyose/melibiose transport system permease protein [Actinopolymorpha rutila]|uniref:Raffinose/stachyose/melibiose transport system permease protein n=2 Tax=Actinopolymorpha rutila TaxID=446787 RepID=A0A852ZAJ0_9ACTN|nr:sugar ABC transporter permease [Actinopolymorpha rutila]NYH90061.1 raffinose/stachyose/melibiose transport system permease protein [Actinopolymorpha rutila]